MNNKCATEMWLFKFRKDKKSSLEHSNVQVLDGVARINSIELSGQYAVSQNNRYLLVYRSGDGFKLNGKFALVKEEEVIFVAKCKRPTGAVVANNGTFVVVDSGEINSYADRVDVYASDGSKIMAHAFSAYTACIGISDMGTHVVVQLHNSKTSDAHRVYVFDVEKSAVVSSFIPKTEAAERFVFSVEQEIVYFCYRNDRKYGYSFAGNFLDIDRYEREREADASATELVLIVRERIESATTETLPDLLALINRALEGDLSYFNYRALAYRAKGEIHEAIGDTERAIAAYKMALKLDSKIGVKQKLRKLTK